MGQNITVYVCSICGHKFRLRDAETVICPNCGGSPETSASSQLQATVLINGSQETVRVNRQASAMPEEWREGDVILDLYEVKGEVGRGELAVVYRVYHRQWNLEMAVKRPLPHLLQHAGGMEAFTRQARAWLDLGLHPHIVTCYYVRRVGDVPCIFTEYIDGGSLKDWIEDGRLYAGDEQEALKRILDVAIQLAWGVGYVHEKGFVHQDVKPSSALMTSDGTLKLAGFGLLGGSKGYTPAYAAPEQDPILGMKVSPRTDIWCWGVSVLEMFTGEVHWVLGSVAAIVLENYLQEAPPEGIPPMPAALAELLRQCFQNDPDQRPASMDEVAERLMRLYEQETGAPYPRQKPRALELRADSLNNKAVSLLELGQEDEAVRCWQEALQADSAHLEANFNYGYYRWQRAELLGSEFLKQLQRLESPRRSNPEYWRLLGWVYLEQGYVEEVEEILEKRGVEDEALRRAHRNPNRPVGREVRRFEGHTDRVTSVAFSPDGRYVLSGSDDTTVRLWTLKTGKQRRRFRGNTQAITTVAFSPTGHYIASAGGKERTVRLWRTFLDYSLVYVVEAHHWLVSSVTFSPDGNYLLSGGADNTAVLWSIKTGKRVRSFVGHTSWVSSVTFSPDGRYVATGSWDGTVRLWSTATGAELKRFDLNTWRVYSVAFSPNGRYILVGSDNPYYNDPKPLRLWDLETDRKTIFAGLQLGVNAVAFSPDSRYALSCGEDGIRIWEIPTGKEIRCLEGHARPVNAVAFSPDGRYALSVSDDKTVRLWEVHYPPFRPTGHFYPALSPVGGSETVSVATARQSQPTVLYDTATDLTDTIPVQTVSIETQWLPVEEESSKRYTCFECGEDVTEMANRDGRAAGLGDVTLYLCANCGRKAREEFKGQSEQIAGYWVLEKLREGGATEVFKGWHPQTGRIVAIEKILSRFSNESSVVYRFQRAIAIMENLLHPNVVRLYESGIVDSVPVLISEFAPDGDLNQFIGEEGQSLLSPEEIVSLIAESLVGLEYFHQQGYVHRDLKPESILLAEKDGQRIPKIANFFFARGFRKDTDTFFTITRTGEYAGTWMYMPPEQITDFKRSRPPLDVYAMGATTYVLLSGWWPLPDFPSFSAVQQGRVGILKRSIPQMILHDRRVPLEERRPDLPRALCRVVDKALAMDARNRYQSAEEFRQALLSAL